MRRLLIPLTPLVVLLAASAPCKSGQVQQQPRDCPQILTQLPTSPQEDVPISRRERFELHQCPEGNIQVYAYRRNAQKPALIFDTYDPWPVQLVSSRNVLVLQSVGGYNHIRVFVFKHGEPSLALTQGVKAYARVEFDGATSALVLEVPYALNESPQTDFRWERHVFPLEF